jgi:hypothetical protein
MSDAPSTPSEEDSNVQRKVNLAAGIVAGSQKVVGVAKAMELVGFSVTQVRSMKLYQQVRRKADKLCVVEKATVVALPEDVVVAPAATGRSIASSLTSNNNSPDEEQTVAEDSFPDLPSTPEVVVKETDIVVSPKAIIKKGRRTSKQLQKLNAELAASKERNRKAMKVATKIIKDQQLLDPKDPTRKSINEIVNTTNTRFNSSINAKTAGRYVRQGLVGQSPLKRGPVGHFPKPVYSALMGAYSTYLKLEQAHSKKQSGTKQMSKLVNATVNSAGFEKTRDDLTRKLQRDTADQFEVGKANITEARRVQWTTAYNLNIWFSTFKELLIHLEFAREKLAGEDVLGELFFEPDQLRRIINIDETDGSIDDTTGQRGGRPPITFVAPDVSGGATAVNKSGYSSTIICGSNAAGEPVPPHFQLKTLAKTEEREKMSIDWFAGTKNIVAQFGYPARQTFSCTFGMNEKAGMNDIELDKYVSNSILPLFPDLADCPGKRVILKVDSGPGRTNLEMLARLRLLGLYLVPGVPNTTSQTQETDQNYGPFKGCFRNNIRLLSQARFDGGLSINVSDLPLLVFGGKCSKTGVELRDSFTVAFSVEANLSCWRKCGAVPLTRLPLESNLVRRELPTGAVAAIVADEPMDPKLAKLERLESMNKFYCQVLVSHGYA